ncbi:hypothetical protein BGX38DRAFT_161392 [Terfezia claveryi]|nr:hypothetical protein BGX38DRAFT_161392 [Terfezia claveryi]
MLSMGGVARSRTLTKILTWVRGYPPPYIPCSTPLHSTALSQLQSPRFVSIPYERKRNGQQEPFLGRSEQPNSSKGSMYFEQNTAQNSTSVQSPGGILQGAICELL